MDEKRRWEDRGRPNTLLQLVVSEMKEDLQKSVPGSRHAGIGRPIHANATDKYVCKLFRCRADLKIPSSQCSTGVFCPIPAS